MVTNIAEILMKALGAITGILELSDFFRRISKKARELEYKMACMVSTIRHLRSK